MLTIIQAQTKYFQCMSKIVQTRRKNGSVIFEEFRNNFKAICFFRPEFLEQTANVSFVIICAAYESRSLYSLSPSTYLRYFISIVYSRSLCKLQFFVVQQGFPVSFFIQNYCVNKFINHGNKLLSQYIYIYIRTVCIELLTPAVCFAALV